MAELFGGMEICGLSVVVAKDGKEHILAAHDSTFALMGDTQEEDRRHVADIVASRMQAICRPAGMTKEQQQQQHGRSSSVSSRSGSLGGSPTEDGPRVGQRPAPMGGPPPIPERTTPGVGSIGRLGSLSGPSGGEIPDQPTDRAPMLSTMARRDSQASQSSTTSSVSRSQSVAGSAGVGGAARPQAQSSVVEDAEDTMKNLRKTFAGIFGDM